MTRLNSIPEKVALVTGGTDGVGREVARSLARQGMQVVVVGRNVTKGRQVAAALNAGAGQNRVEYLQADLSLMREVRRLAETVYGRYDRLDLLVHSAGLIRMKFDLTGEGLEMNFAVDYLSRFLLTNLLLDLLQAGAPSRIINIAASRGKGKLDFEQMRRPKYGGMRALGQAQLANDVFTLELAERLRGSGVEAAVLHPGMVDTNIRREFPRLLNTVLGLIFRPMVMTAAEGAKLPLWLALEADTINGKLFKPKRKEIAPAASLLDSTHRRRLWQVSAELVGLREGKDLVEQR